MLFYQEFDTPVGQVIVAADQSSLAALCFASAIDQNRIEPSWQQHGTPLLLRCHEQLQQYFRRERREIDLPCRHVGTEFQKMVWRKLRDIPFGQTWTYGQLAHSLGRPESVRAVGQAIRANPLPIILPCHRVIGSDNSIKGHPGGAAVKESLLNFEAFGFG
ncbi:methylated-DNA--[protein]-cysteine S-methyltransferase [Microbulbifer sp. SH-1]|uniref:methylated-DNA--[protein]-cysteine S-methyltransferase n=1 Tax=Microbulbifer sp. SH-1 TaxID=2681547 RepID=UPI00140E36A6|nr:methylated-DNA--[protein]-cysteine S-methyltransferase [Microbulbifer sp. SH-1]QIL90527.1 methylated-DNA--[protein]-cysteine S-methyltransferase [Microbulbifer sp. SH-1]